MNRSELEAYKLYFEEDSNKYFATPGGEGVVWYDTLEEAEDETGLDFIATNTVKTLRDW